MAFIIGGLGEYIGIRPLLGRFVIFRGQYKRLAVNADRRFNSPKINPEYHALIDKLGSRYVGVNGYYGMNINPKNPQMISVVYNGKLELKSNYYFYYFIVVDLERSEFVYREYKRIPMKLNIKNINGFLYDSYNVFINNLES